ncbi:MAG TPA: alpha/beta fold hydrolase [Acidimicrobiales bacterium]|nr:alpha/beta fold hydrolase [Acidimicrobiales bacterium]
MLPRPPWWRALAVLVAVALVAGCSRGDDGATAPAPPSTGGPTGSAAPTGGRPGDRPPVDDGGPADPAAHATLGSWERCRGAFQCATLTVPRDWSELDGPTLDLAVMRRPATGERIGSLLLNPGGPGASGRDFLEGFTSLPTGLGDRFDVVAWDPRGTGGSQRIDCTSDEELLGAEIDPTPEDPADVAAIRADAQEGLDACLAAVGDLLEVVGTRSTVRDLDALRGALGDDALTYLGYSYGTTIGLEYLRRYPHRVRAMVLDGVSLPGVDPVEDVHVQAQGFERTLGAYLAACPRRPGCPLGQDPRATLADVVARLEAERVPASYALGADGAQRQGTAGVGELYVAVAVSLYSEQGWGQLDRALAEVLGPEPAGRTLLSLRDSYYGRTAEGAWHDDADARGAIRCADQEARAAQPEGDPALADRWGAELPFWGRWFAVGTPGCWGLPPATEPLATLADGAVADAPPVVLVGSTEDPATPYQQARDAHRVVEGSRLVTYEGPEHTAYRSLTDCIDNPVTAYLVALTLPPADLRCPG